MSTVEVDQVAIDITTHMLPLMWPQVDRDITSFAQEEVTLPRGPRRDMKFDAGFMPFYQHFLDALECDRWNRYAIVGPTQSGKSLVCTNIPLLYYLFEKKDDLIFGIPDMQMAKGIWEEKLKPVIMSTEYSKLMPDIGSGSRGGVGASVMFKNGSNLRFMGAGGGDAQRSSHTAPYIIVTEADKICKSGVTSTEAAAIYQIMARADSFEDGRVIVECTPSTEDGFIWQEAMVNGSGGEIHVPCPHCDQYQTLTMDQLQFDPENEITAEESARYQCVKCEKGWDDNERIEALERPLIVHKGQTIEGGKVVGELPPTRTFGMHYNVLYSPMQSIGKTAAQKRKADNSVLTDEKKQFRQFKEALPWKDEERIDDILTVTYMKRRAEASEDVGLKLKELPTWATELILSVDVQKGWLYWHVDAWGPFQQSQVVEYGTVDIQGDPKRGLPKALDEVEDYAVAGWSTADGNTTMQPILRLVDTGYRYDIISPWLRTHRKWRGVKGWGKGQKELLSTKALWKIPGILDIRQHDDGNQLWFVHVDETKGIVQDRYFVGPGESGYTHVPCDITQSYMMHMCAEKREYTSELSDDFVWVKLRRRNDYLDTRSYSVAGNMFLIIKGDEIQRRKEQQKVKKGAANKKRLVDNGSSGGYINSRGRWQ